MRESLALILDRQRQLEETQKVVYLCFSWRQHTVLGLQGGESLIQTLMTKLEGHRDTFLLDLKAETRKLAKMEQKIFLFRCLLGERLPWLNPKSLFCSNCKYTSTWTQLGKEKIIFSLTRNKNKE